MGDKSAIRVTPLEKSELQVLHALLSKAGLPTEDLMFPGRSFYRFDEQGQLLGFIGLEGEGTDRLLRSLVVSERRRGMGGGRCILAMLENIASISGVLRLHLLTNTAPDFFSANGYRIVPRGEAPESISCTTEFKSLCPASAVYMVKDIRP